MGKSAGSNGPRLQSVLKEMTAVFVNKFILTINEQDDLYVVLFSSTED